MLVESTTDTEGHFAIKLLKSLNSSDLHVHEISSFNTGFGITLIFYSSVSHQEKCSMPIEEHPSFIKQTSNHNTAKNL